MERFWKYYKCNNCGKENMINSLYRYNYYTCECKNTVYYSEAVEQAWLNETDENGDRIRLDFAGWDEEECRRNAAKHFGCEKEDISEYYLVQKPGLFKKCIICASKPKFYEEDKDAIRILMWENENRPRKWADINVEKKTILYPCVMGDEKQYFNKIVGFKKSEDSGACRNFKLILEPQGEIEFCFYPGYFGDIGKLLDIVSEFIEPIKQGMYTEKVSTRLPFDADKGGFLEISCDDFNMSGRMNFWKKDETICLLDADEFHGIDISIKDIKYYRLIGQKYVTTEISGGGGGGSSIKGAVIGGLIAGDVGAIVGSRKAVEEVKGTSTIHDEQVVLLYSNDLKQVMKFSSNAYAIFTKLIPEKDYEVVIQSNNEQMNDTIDNTRNNVDAIREYKKLLDEGIITQEDFDKKKKELLGL